MIKFKNQIFLIISIFILVFGVIVVSDLYFGKSRFFFTKNIANIFSLPVIKVNDEVISHKIYSNFWENYKYSFQKPLENKAEYKKIVIDALIREVLMNQIKQDLALSFTEEKFENFKENFYQNKNNLVLLENLQKDNFWKESSFNRYVLRPLFLRSKINQKLLDDNLNRENKIKIEKIYNEIMKNPEVFDNYSQKYQDHNLTTTTGTISWLTYRDLPDNLKYKILNYELGEFSPVLKSWSGYHIYKLIGKIKEEKNGNFYYQLSQIFLPLKDFDSYFQKYAKNSELKVYLK